MQSADFKHQDPARDDEEEELLPIITWRNRQLENLDEESAEDAVASSKKTSSKEPILPDPPRFNIYKHSKEIHNDIFCPPSVVEVASFTPLRIFSAFPNNAMLDRIGKHSSCYARAHKAGKRGS